MPATKKKRGQPRNPSKKSDRADLRAGPLGDTFFGFVARVAQGQGSTFTQYVRAAVLEKLKRDGEPFAVPERT